MRSSAGARSAWNFALRARLPGGDWILLLLAFNAIVRPKDLSALYFHSYYTASTTTSGVKADRGCPAYHEGIVTEHGRAAPEASSRMLLAQVRADYAQYYAHFLHSHRLHRTACKSLQILWLSQPGHSRALGFAQEGSLRELHVSN